MNKKQHWENIYSTKNLTEVSWYQKKPTTAIEYLNDLNIKKDDAIIDVGGGDSFFVDYLIENNFTDITVLDISENALKRAKERIGSAAQKVNWIITDASTFESNKQYNFWYDRAAFHFLTEKKAIENYRNNLAKNIAKNGQVVIGTFANDGPTKCSGIDITQYDALDLEHLFQTDFDCFTCQKVNHPTPFDTTQAFTFCSFKKK